MACGTESEQQGKYNPRSDGVNKPFDPTSCNSEDKENEVVLCVASDVIRAILITSGINISCFRLDQSGALQVDNGDTVSARAPGHLTQLNTDPTLFLGEPPSKLNIEHQPVHTKAANFPLTSSTFNHALFNKNLFTPSRGQNNFKVCHFTS